MLASATQCLYAVQAKRDVVRTLIQPDGTTLNVTLCGDESAHCYITTDNIPVLQAEDGRWCFATLDSKGMPVPSAIAAANPDERNGEQKTLVNMLNPEAIGEAIFSRGLLSARSKAMKAPAAKVTSSKGIGLFDEVCFPSDGERHALVILVQYSDIKFTVNNAGDYFDRFLNETGFNDNGATGSVRDFYKKGSGEFFTPHFDLYGPVTLKNRRSYYGGNDSWGNDLRPCQMVREACELLDDQINFADYDLDNDGYVDNVYIIYAGQGEADFGSAECIWPHRWSLSADGVSCTLDGKFIENYGCCNEWGDNSVTGIGTFCHEFGHVMGLPDLYSTSYNNATSLTPGSWSVMDYGPYLNNGRTPPTFSAFERNALGWIDLQELKDPASISLENIHDSNSACIIETGNKNEFFLLENRQKTGWDTYLPGHGMLIWHIDFDQKIWNDNVVNNTANHQRVDIVEANGLPDNGNDSYLAGYAFPGTSRVTSFTSETKPALKTWAGKDIDVPITEIAENNGIITFEVSGGSSEIDAPQITVSDITSTSFVVNWDAVRGAKQYKVYLTDSESALLNGYPVETKETSYTVNYLTHETKYLVTVRSVKGDFESEDSEKLEVTTTEYSFVNAFPQTLPATNISVNGFTANWTAIDQAEDYRLTVITNQPVSTETHTCEFVAGNPIGLTEGWTTTSEAVYESKDYVGQEIPSLKLARHGMYLCSPIFAKDLTEVKFWYRGAGSDVTNYLEVEARADESSDWTLLRKIQPLVLTKGGETVTVKNIPSGMHQMRIIYYKPKNGNVAIDDVTVTLGGSSLQYHADYNAKSVGKVLSHTINVQADRAVGEGEGVTMYYSVCGVNSEGTMSQSSQLMSVTLSGEEGVSSIISDINSDVRLYDLNGRPVNDTPAPGIYILRQGSKVSKVAVK